MSNNYLNINDLYYPLREDQSRYLILYGGADSGKSHFAAQKIIMRCLQESNHRVLLVRKVQHTIRHSQFQILKDIIIQAGLLGSFTLVPSNLRIDGPNNCEIIGAGIDDPEKLKSIHGITIVWIEEATELLQEDFEELDRRVRGVKQFYKQIIMSFNPINDAHWLNHTFFLDLPPKQHCIQLSNHRGMPVTICQSNYEDNKYVDPLDAQRYGTFTGNTAIIYTIGLWGGKTDPDQLISYEMIQNAFFVEPKDGVGRLGCDIAWEGDDKDVYIHLEGNQLKGIYDYDYLEINRKAAIIRNLAVENIIDADKVAVDVVGPGGPGTYERLITLGLNPVKFIAGASAIPHAFEDDSIRKMGYKNLRAQAHMYVRKRFLDKKISFPEKTTKLKFLIGDLTSIHYFINNEKKIQIEEKKQIKNRIGRSPDYSDAYIMAEFVPLMRAIQKITQVKFI